MVPFSQAACLLVIAVTCLWPSLGPTAPEPPSAPPQDPAGHLVLVVEGNVGLLRVTGAVAKADAWGGVPKGLASDFALVGLDAKDAQVVRVPIDLSAFDTDPAHVGAPTVVTGCIVRSPDIGVLVNVPADDRIARWTIRRDDAQIGEATALDIATLLRGGR
jgi:hypothetical protein